MASIRERDPVLIQLMGSAQTLRGHVASLARGIEVPNAQPNPAGLAKVNPIFTWVRLAQRVPVRIHLDELPKDVPLVAGMTATVEVKPLDGARASPPSLVTKVMELMTKARERITEAMERLGLKASSSSKI